MNKHTLGFILRGCMHFNQLIGINTIPFNRKTGRFEENNLLAMVWCLILHIGYLVTMPFAVTLLVRTYYICESITITAVFVNVLAYAKQVAVMTTFWGIWFRRRPLIRIANRYAHILLTSADELFTLANQRKQIAHCVRMSVFKLLFWHIHVILILMQLFSYGSGASCGRLGGVFMPPGYIPSALLMIYMEVIIGSVDCTLFVGQAVGNMLVSMLQQQLNDIYADLRLLCRLATCRCRRQWLYSERPRRCHHTLWLLQLQRAFALLNMRRRRLRAMQVDCLAIFQWQLLVLLYVDVFQAVYLLFRTLLFSYTSFNLVEFIVYVCLFLLFYFEIMLRFYMFEQLNLLWRHFARTYYDIWLAMATLDDIGACHDGVLLSRRLEFGLFEFSRQLAPEPQRVRRLQIAGLLDLNNESSFGMSSTIIMNVLILCQLAMQSVNQGTLRSDGSE